MSMLLCSCGGCKESEEETSEVENVYNDATLRTICELKCAGNTAELIKYFSSDFPQYRKAAVDAIGSMRDSMAILPLVGLLSHSDFDIRESAAFALGQTRHPLAEKYLLEGIEDDQPDNVKAAMLVALGKCGSHKALETVQNFKAPYSNVTLVSGVARSLCWFANRGMFTIATSHLALSILCDQTIHEKARSIAAEYFGICNTDFSLYTDEFVTAYRSAKLIHNKVNIVLALGKCHNERAFSLIKSIVKDENSDYRVVMNAIAALENYPYEECKPYILDLLKSDEEKISSRAAIYIYNRGTADDAREYLDLSRTVAGWQTRTMLTSAALRYSVNKDEISQRIRSGFEASQNVYEKAALLSALKADISNFRFVDKQASNGDNDDLVCEEGIKTLVSMYESSEFEEYASNWKTNYGEDLYDEFGLIFKKAVQNGNSRMVAIAADVIGRHPEMYQKYMTPYFIKQAVSNCVLPRDADTYIILKKVVKIVLGSDIEDYEPTASAMPDWEYIRKIKPGEEIVISTRKGDITVKTDVNKAPIAVSNFLKLVDDQYFDKSQFNNITLLHVENRGSLSSFDANKAIMVPSELTSYEFEEGTVALNTSAFNNSCTTQWFVMLIPDALSDGGSSVLGVITDGMEVVHSINTGDEIFSISRKK